MQLYLFKKVHLLFSAIKQSLCDTFENLRLLIFTKSKILRQISGMSQTVQKNETKLVKQQTQKDNKEEKGSYYLQN